MWCQKLDTRNATRRVSQLSAILLHQEQAGEIAKTQLLCVYLPRLERKPWQPLSKLGGCSGMSLQLPHFAEAMDALLRMSHPPPSARKVRTAARAAAARCSPRQLAQQEAAEPRPERRSAELRRPCSPLRKVARACKGGNFTLQLLQAYLRSFPGSKEISWRRLFSIYFLFIVRSRNSFISDPIRSTSSSNAKWPVSRRWSSALGISLFKSSAPSTVKIPSFLPHVINVGG